MDKLDIIFNEQKRLQDMMKVDYHSQGYKNMMVLASVDELMEYLHETPWKAWKKNQKYDPEKAKEELIDAFHFFINLCLSEGLTSADLYNAYMKKNIKNEQRYENGY